MIVNLGSKTGENNYNSSPQLTHLHNSLLMSIIDTPEKDLSNIDRISDMRKVLTSSVKPSSTFCSCSIRAMYDRVNSAQKQCLMLKSYIPGIDTSIFQ